MSRSVLNSRRILVVGPALSALARSAMPKAEITAVTAEAVLAHPAGGPMDLVILDAEETRREDYDELVSRGVAVHVTHVRRLSDVEPVLATLAARLDVSRSPSPIVASTPAPRRRAVVPIWRRPWMVLGAPTYGASLLAHLGIAVITGSTGPYPTVTLDEVVECRADVVIAPSEPYPFSERQRDELERIAPTVFVDGKDLFWWGVRTPGALERLGERLSSP